MKKIIMAIAAPVLIVMLACGSGQSGSQSSSSEQSLISWVKFDDGLNQAAQIDKPVMAFFWRDG